MSVVLTYSSLVTAKETLATNVPAATAANRLVTHDQYNTVKTLNSGTSPPATETAAFEQALTGGAATIDLEALLGTAGKTVVGTGLRVQALKFRNKAANAAVMTLKEGAANGYDGFGASFSITLPPSGEVTILTEDGGTNISPTNSDLDLAGDGVEIAELEIILG